MVEHLIVTLDNVGSTPIRHPDSPGGRMVNAVVRKTTLCKFNSYPGVHAFIAELVEATAIKQEIAGSNPAESTTY